MYQLLQSTRFEMYLLVILHFDSALGKVGGGAPLYRLYRYDQRQRDVFLRHFSQKWSIDFGHFGLKLGMVFAL